VQDKSFLGHAHEDPKAHLMTYDTLRDTFRQKGVSKEFVLLKLFRWPLKEKAKEWFNSLLTTA
jgi:hypothetical protein